MSSNMSLARLIRVFSPPDSASKERERISAPMPRPLQTLFSRVSASYPPPASKAAVSWSYRAITWGSSPSAIFAVSSESSASMAWRGAKAVSSTSRTVYPSGYTGIWEISPSRLPGAMAMVPSSG